MRAAWSCGRSVTAATTVVTGLMKKTAVRNQTSSELQQRASLSHHSRHLVTLEELLWTEGKTIKINIVNKHIFSIVLSPAGYNMCNFEDDLCDWDLRSLSTLKWVRTSQENISISDPVKGPGRDHSNNSASGVRFFIAEILLCSGSLFTLMK